MIRIIDNKKIDLTDQEFRLYQNLLQGYDPRMKPETLFHDLFEVDKNGIILFLKPPTNKYFTMEIFMFLMSIMQHQHLRIMYKRIDEVTADCKTLIAETKHEINLLKTKNVEG